MDNLIKAAALCCAMALPGSAAAEHSEPSTGHGETAHTETAHTEAAHEAKDDAHAAPAGEHADAPHETAEAAHETPADGHAESSPAADHHDTHEAADEAAHETAHDAPAEPAPSGEHPDAHETAHETPADGHAEPADAGHDTHAAGHATADAAHPAPAHGKPHWTYEGDSGPEHWGEMSAEFAACSAGRVQSPIDVSLASAHGERGFAASYRPVPLQVLHNGHTVQFNTPGSGELVLNGVTFELLQIHFHTPSEHVVRGQHAPLEAHFVHKSAGGALAVLGVFVIPGAENPALAALIRHLPEHETPAADHPDTAIDPSDLLPAERGFTWYLGSLTTPPCSEGVNWHVLSTPITASPEQIARLERAMGHNARPPQNLHGRLVVAP